MKDVVLTVEGRYHLQLLNKQAHHKKGYSGTLQSMCDSPRNRQFFCVSIKDCLVKCNHGCVFPS